MPADQAVQLVGAILILVPFVAAQFGWLSPHAIAYLVLNLLGAAVLAAIAAVGEDWGFLLLEAVWTAVSAWSLMQVLRGRSPAGAH